MESPGSEDEDRIPATKMPCTNTLNVIETPCFKARPLCNTKRFRLLTEDSSPPTQAVRYVTIEVHIRLFSGRKVFSRTVTVKGASDPADRGTAQQAVVIDCGESLPHLSYRGRGGISTPGIRETPDARWAPAKPPKYLLT